MKTKKDVQHLQLDWLVSMVKEIGIDVPKTLIFCNTMNEGATVVDALLFKLGKNAYYSFSMLITYACSFNVLAKK